LAEVLTTRTPGLDRVSWTDSGYEAVDLAVRLARAVTGRRLVATWSTDQFDDDILRLPPDPAAAAKELLTGAGAVLAGVVLDGLDLLGSLDVAGRASWPGLRELLLRLAATGTVLVADERRTLGAGAIGGLGVLGLGGRVDLVVYGASLFGGLEAGAVCGRTALVVADATGAAGRARLGGDASKHIHPVPAAAALATLRVADPIALERLGARATRVRAALGLPGFGPAVGLPRDVAADLLVDHILVDAKGWAWLSTATDDADEEWLLAALRPVLG
jgi:glutamate-1-semialdehyde aminotransferase